MAAEAGLRGHGGGGEAGGHGDQAQPEDGELGPGGREAGGQLGAEHHGEHEAGEHPAQPRPRPAPGLGRRDRGQAGAGGEHRRVGDVDCATGVHILEPLLLARLPPLDQQAGLRGHLGRLQLNRHETHKTNYFQLDYVLQRNI